MDFFGKEQFSKKESLLVLYSLKASLGLGISLAKAVELQSKSQKGLLGKKLKVIAYLIKVKNRDIAEVFFKFKLLNKEEKAILENAKNAKQAILDVIEMREINGAFNKTLASIVMMPMISMALGLLLAYKLVPIFLKPLDSIMKILKIKGVTIGDDMQISEVFWYVNHHNLIMPILIGYLIFIGGLVFAYFYLRNYKPSVIYKIFSLAAYDDAPFILMYMRALNRSGVSSLHIAEILATSNIKAGWKQLFANIKKAIKKSSAIYLEFKKYGFPNEITNFMKYAEEAKSFWDNIDNLITVSKERNIDGNKNLKRYLGTLSVLVSYGIILYFLMGSIIIMLQITTASTAMMG